MKRRNVAVARVATAARYEAEAMDKLDRRAEAIRRYSRMERALKWIADGVCVIDRGACAEIAKKALR